MPPESILFREILGHDSVRTFLQSTVQQDRLAHALLFAGAEGIGKRRFALAFAAWLQCQQRADDACGECSACRQVAASSHPDVKLVGLAEKKKEIGVDRARELKRFTQLRPASAAQKVAIVDAAQCLSIAAQNALLKTLEDPPLRSILILVANNPDALLATVRSRCQRVNFQPLPKATVASILAKDHELSASAAEQLAAVSEGSPGRALELHRHLDKAAGASTPDVDQYHGMRYVDLMQAANSWTQPEDGLQAKLEIVLAQVRDHAAEAAHSGDRVATARWLRRAQVLAETTEVLRRKAPNKQLLLDNLMLQLARC